MKKLLRKVFLFFVLVAVMDVICDWTFVFLRSRTRGGQTFKNEYLFNSCKDDILILGSSRANHHYVPIVLTDSLGLTCYNAGEQGCGIIPAYVWYRAVRERRKPKLVLYEITPEYDFLLDKGGYSRYLGAVKQYANRDDVKKVYLDFSDELEPLRLISGMYRNNSALIKCVKDLFKPTPNNKGYDPLSGVIKVHEEKDERSVRSMQSRIEIDSLKLAYLERLIVETKEDGVQLAFFVSPFFRYEGNMAEYEPAIELSRRYSIPMLVYANCEQFVGKNDCFQDNTHLNNKGALAYSQFIIPQIRPLLKDRQ